MLETNICMGVHSGRNSVTASLTFLWDSTKPESWGFPRHVDVWLDVIGSVDKIQQAMEEAVHSMHYKRIRTGELRVGNRLI